VLRNSLDSDDAEEIVDESLVLIVQGAKFGQNRTKFGAFARRREFFNGIDPKRPPGCTPFGPSVTP
jgi:hypothetical protein